MSKNQMKNQYEMCQFAVHRIKEILGIGTDFDFDDDENESRSKNVQAISGKTLVYMVIINCSIVYICQ